MIIEIGVWKSENEEIIAKALTKHIDKLINQLQTPLSIIRNISPFRLLNLPKQTKLTFSQQLNSAVEKTNAKNLIFLSAAVAVEENWLLQLLQPLHSFTSDDIQDVKKEMEIINMIANINNEEQRLYQFANFTHQFISSLFNINYTRDINLRLHFDFSSPSLFCIPPR